MARHRKLDETETSGRRSLSDMQLVLETTGVGVWAYDGASNTFRLDDTCRAMFDLDPGQEMNMQVMQQRIHPDDIGPYWDAVKDAVESGVLATNYRVICRNGSIRFISGRGRAMPCEPGEAVQIKGVCIDVTDRKQLENRLRSTEERMQHLADGVPGLFSYIDRSYRVQFMSSRYRGIFERDRDGIIDQHIGDLIGQAAFEERKPRYDRALNGEVVYHESTRIMPDGTERYFAVTHQPHRDERGDIVGILSLGIDITDRRRVEEELARSNHDLEQFAYVASHDLKAPLRAIEVLVQWLREDLKDYDGGEVQENLSLLTQRSQRLNRLLDDLLEYSRAGRRIGDRRNVDTRLLVKDIGALLSPPPGMRIEADSSLPAIDAFGAPLEQVLRNLINNAIKHHPSQEGLVRVYAIDQADHVLFAVEDDGAGIPAEYAEKVFQMFQTLQPRDEREGSGMGLAIVKRIVDWQGGRIWFHPGSGDRGTVFKFIWNKLPESPGGERSTQGINSDVWKEDATRKYSAG